MAPPAPPASPLPAERSREPVSTPGGILTLSLVVFATATDAGLNTPELVAGHQRWQVADVRENIPRMRYPGGRSGVGLLADQLESLPRQLYVQLVCQVSLLHDIVGRAINYFAQSVVRRYRISIG